MASGRPRALVAVTRVTSTYAGRSSHLGIAVGSTAEPDAPNGSVGRVSVARALVTPGLPIVVTAEVANAGPGPLSRTAELLVDGVTAPDSTRAISALPAGGKTSLTFTTTISEPGAHLLTARLVGGDDALPADDESSVAVEVASALNVLLVDGEPGREPFTGEVDFLRAALAPTGDDTPQVHASVVEANQFTSDSLKDQRMLILANVERLDPDQTVAVARFLEAGGGVLVAPGDRCDAAFWNGLSWLPAGLGDRVGDYAARKVVAHPAPSTFSGPVLPPFAQGEAPPLASADMFAYRILEPSAGASVSARLDTKAPWVVERGQGRGRVLVLAGPLDAEGGTLPVNPDFVPLVHEWALHLAGGSAPASLRPGEPAEFALNPAPAATLKSLPLLTPAGDAAQATIVRGASGVKARYEETSEPGVYRLTRPDPPGGFAYVVVQGDSSLIDDSALDPAEASKLSEGWPLEFAPDADRLASHLFTTGPGARRELWRGLVLAALAGLCMEVYLTRKLVRGQGLA